MGRPPDIDPEDWAMIWVCLFILVGAVFLIAYFGGAEAFNP